MDLTTNPRMGRHRQAVNLESEPRKADLQAALSAPPNRCRCSPPAQAMRDPKTPLSRLRDRNRFSWIRNKQRSSKDRVHSRTCSPRALPVCVEKTGRCATTPKAPRFIGDRFISIATLIGCSFVNRLMGRVMVKQSGSMPKQFDMSTN